MEIPCGVDNSQRIVELGGLVALILYIQKKILEIVIRYRKFVKKAILLENLHTKME